MGDPGVQCQGKRESKRHMGDSGVQCQGKCESKRHISDSKVASAHVLLREPDFKCSCKCPQLCNYNSTRQAALEGGQKTEAHGNLSPDDLVLTKSPGDVRHVTSWQSRHILVLRQGL
eukprot:scaffold15250_cov21-Tisochrysis_lutea.AAC.2